MIELRSDTFTKPTPGMLDAMMHAEVGDDVFGEDPTVNKLESKLAALFGMDEGVFLPFGHHGQPDWHSGAYPTPG